MSSERLDDLLLLDPSKFDRREHAALSWVRAFLTCPGGIPADIEREFELQFTDEERKHVAAAMKAMFCANLTVNTNRFLACRLLRKDEPALSGTCVLPR